MEQAKRGDTIKVHYTATLDDGRVFDSSTDRKPIQITLGKGQVIPGFEEAILGLSPGESKTTRISSDKAFGQRRNNATLDIKREKLPDSLNPSVGTTLRIRTARDNKMVWATVVDVSDSSIKLDMNHPLAGKDLTFEIQLVEIL
jgi:peptidylprolyl isomerase